MIGYLTCIHWANFQVKTELWAPEYIIKLKLRVLV